MKHSNIVKILFVLSGIVLASEARAENPLGSLDIVTNPVFDKIDERGALLHEIFLPFNLDLGKNASLPARIVLQTKPRHIERSFVGTNNWFPILDCSVVSLAENHVVVNTLTGGYIDLFANGGDSNEFVSQDQQFTGKLLGNSFVLNSKDGWSMVFEKGRIKALSRFGKELLRWSYREKMIAISGKDGEKILATLAENGTVTSLQSTSSGSDAFHFEYSELPHIALVQNQFIPVGTEPILKVVRFGKNEILHLENILSKDLESVTTEIDTPGVSSRFIWDLANGVLKNYDQNSYLVDKGQNSQTNKISKVGPDGTILKSYYFDFASMTAVATNASETTRRSYVAMPGPVYGKMREVLVSDSNSADGQAKSTRFYYDDKGRLMRMVKREGTAEIVHQYSNGILTSVKNKDGKLTTYDIDAAGNRIVKFSDQSNSARYSILPNGTLKIE